ncbi:MAG: twin-arginine translocase subunit TatC [SAR202 cluster bacterium]|nr:twin-arginine translocase subunit TatC [Dehalococcoidia bacterium]MEE3003833.1 twin-arginine translocase subunit TatC [Chloroflexota bacterium]MQG78945.1 twin-arginine translocase subunit TatC [SAR202 cluster bacterium]|tara:strand:+ start:3004 stop:3756 length:753 start_codon:yes stop_codon:yes gene_type:complete
MRSREQTLLQHLGELRRRVFICVVAVLVGSAVSFAFFEQIIDILVEPAKDLNLGTGGELIYTEVTELLTTAIKVSFVSGLILASPILVYQGVMFVAPGLTGREKRYLFGFMPAVVLAFGGGVAFAYYILTPPALHFLLTFGGDVATPLIRISNIINLMIRLLFWMGLAFETPLVMYLLASLGIVSARGLSRFRRYWVVVAFILAAIITPTVDPVNQALVAGPLLVLYEVGILLARIAGRSRGKFSAITST